MGWLYYLLFDSLMLLGGCVLLLIGIDMVVKAVRGL